MSVSTKKIDDKYAKKEKKRSDELAKKLRDNAVKDSKVTIDQGKKDLKTVGSEVGRVFDNVNKDSKSQYDAARAQLQANNSEINTTLGGIHQGNMASNVNDLNRLGLGNVGTLGSQQQANMNDLISSLQGQYNIDNLNLQQRDQDLTFDSQKQMGKDMVGQLGTNLTNRFNTDLNKSNQDLRDTYLKNQYSLKDALARNRQAEEVRKKQEAAARAAQARYAAGMRLRSGTGSGNGNGNGGDPYENRELDNAEVYNRHFDTLTKGWSPFAKVAFPPRIGGPLK